jgi:hypothetical protein
MNEILAIVQRELTLIVGAELALLIVNKIRTTQCNKKP